MSGLSFVLQESRVGQYGNNVTRLLYKITSLKNVQLDINLYAAPTTNIYVSLHTLLKRIQNEFIFFY
jgi:hypothetical protein